jgi:hypothetical protein
VLLLEALNIIHMRVLLIPTCSGGSSS